MSPFNKYFQPLAQKLGVIRFQQLRWNLLVRLVGKAVISVPHPSEECTSGPLSRCSRVLWDEFPAQFVLLIFIYKLSSCRAVSLSFSFLHTLCNGSKFSFSSSLLLLSVLSPRPNVNRLWASLERFSGRLRSRDDKILLVLAIEGRFQASLQLSRRLDCSRCALSGSYSNHEAAFILMRLQPPSSCIYITYNTSALVFCAYKSTTTLLGVL